MHSYYKRMLALCLSALLLFSSAIPIGAAEITVQAPPEESSSSTTVPEVSKPEASEPEATQPEATEPEATQPEATEPEATQPEATEPETTEPEATEPETTEPEATEPETTEPEATEPETTEPEATEPETTEPEVSKPEATEPEATQPEVSKPEATEPEATEPEATEPEATEPPLDPSLAYPIPVDTEVHEIGSNITPFSSIYITSEPNLSLPQISYRRMVWQSGNPSNYVFNWGNYYGKDVNFFKFSNGMTGYCMQPYKSHSTGTYYENLGWADFDRFRQQGVALALAYGAPNNGDYSNEGQWATAMLVRDMAMGYRNPDGSLTFNATWGEPNKWSHFGNSLRDNAPAVYAKYEAILADLAKHGKIPSFSQKKPDSAPTYTMQYNASSRTYSVTLTDTNGVLKNYNYSSNISGLTFKKNGNQLIVTATEDAAKQLNNATIGNRGFHVDVGPDACTVWTSNTSASDGGAYQIITTLKAPTDPSASYFKLYAKPQKGNLDLYKTTEDGLYLGEWNFRITGNGVDVTRTTDWNGHIHVADLAPGTYTVTELKSNYPKANDRYNIEPSKTVTIVSGQTATVKFHNRLKPGAIKIVKTTSTDGSLGGWKIGIYTDSGCTQPISGSPFTTGGDGTITTGSLSHGTYYAKEINESASRPDWVFDTSVKTVTVEPGKTATVSFYNKQLGRIVVNKTAVNGSASGWHFDVLNSSGTVIETLTTGTDGKAYSKYLEPGQYTVREIHDADGTYWQYDVNVEQGVTVQAGPSTYVYYTNVLNSRIEITKTTNTGTHLEGWEIGIYTDIDCLNPIPGSPFTTGADGKITTEQLAPGTYYAKELATPTSHPEWHLDSSVKTIIAEAGKTASVSFNNVLMGRVKVTKTAINGSAQDWVFDIYDSSNQIVDTITTDASGFATSTYLLPGTYTVRERHDANREYYWTFDAESDKTVTINPGDTSDVSFTNTQNGRIEIIKKIQADDTLTHPVSGWQFRISNKQTGLEIPGSPFTTDENGKIATDQLSPGEYIVEELIPADSLYFCKSENPQTIVVIAGETASVTFTNAVRPGSVTINKVDYAGRPLAGAKFLLEWSTDRTTWQPVFYNDKETVVLGGSNNPNIVDGCLTSDESGIIAFDGLHPSVSYRLTEVAAPNGYVLLKDPVFIGNLEVEEGFEKTFTVVNEPIFSLPQTGKWNTNSRMVIGGTILTGLAIILITIFSGIYLIHRSNATLDNKNFYWRKKTK